MLPISCDLARPGPFDTPILTGRTGFKWIQPNEAYLMLVFFLYALLENNVSAVLFSLLAFAFLMLSEPRNPNCVVRMLFA